MGLFYFIKNRNKKKLAAMENRQDPGQPAYLISAPMIWSPLVESHLEEAGIPYLKRGRKGAALAIELGAGAEIYDYYVPRQALAKASEGLVELKEIIGFQDP